MSATTESVLIPRTDPDLQQRVGIFVPCDAKECGMRSYYFPTINGSEMSFCGHHANQYEVKLMPLASKIIDLRYTIIPSVN